MRYIAILILLFATHDAFSQSIGAKAQITNSGNGIANALPEKFQKKLSESKMVFTKPKGTTEVPIVENTGVHYDYALKLNDKNIEIRYLVLPIYKWMFDTYNNRRQKSTGDTVPEPNKLHTQFALHAVTTDPNTLPQWLKDLQ